MANVLVTGGTGFLGGKVVQRLRDAGHDVRVLARSPGATHRGSILDPAVLHAAVSGCEFVFHLAGRVDRGRDAWERLRSLHVDGTVAVVEAAADAGVARVVYASTSGTVAVGRDPLKFYTEEDPPPTKIVARWPYYATKLAAEEAAFEAAARLGVSLVSLNPSLLLGPGDVRGSSTTDVADLLAGRVPAIPGGGLSFVDVRDVADVAVAAMETGRSGERYLLGTANWSLGRFFETVAELGGVRPPRLRAPGRPTRWLAHASAGIFERLGRRAPLDPISVEMAQHFWYLDASKAVRELGFTPRRPEDTLRDTIEWLRSRGLR